MKGVKKLNCKYCGVTVEVGDNAVAVVCGRCAVTRNLSSFGWPEGTQPKRPEDLIKKPAGWHFMKEFVDELGHVYHRGVEVPELFGTLEPTEFAAKNEDRPKSKPKRNKKATQDKMLVALHEKKTAMRKAQVSGNYGEIQAAEIDAMNTARRIRKLNRKGG